MNSNTVQVGSFAVGDGHPTVFVAEVGNFYNQDIDLAIEFLRKTQEAGAGIFKTEIIHDANICLDSGMTCGFRHANGEQQEDYRALVERKIVSLEKYKVLFEECKKIGMEFLASVYDFEGVDFMKQQGAVALKIARDNIDNIPLIRRAASTDLPIIFDAGVTYFHEVAKAVSCARQAGTGGVIVNHHPGKQPAPAEFHNFQIIKSYKKALNVPVGLACHYRGDEMLYVGIGQGVNIIEKGVVDDPDKIDQDHVSCCNFEELPGIIEKVNNCWKSLGVSAYDPEEPRDMARRKGIVAKKPIAAGDLFTEENISFAWPPIGIPVDNWDRVLGCKAVKALSELEPVRWKDVDFGTVKDYEIPDLTFS